MFGALLRIVILLLVAFGNLCAQDTFSIVAVDPNTGEVGSAGASCVDLTNIQGITDDFLGELFPGIGAINTQAWYRQTNQINARNQMQMGRSPQQIITWLTQNDVDGTPELRQYGIVALVDDVPEAAAFTGKATDDFKGHLTGGHFAIQGNILLGPEILESMRDGFLNAEGDLACKLMAALQGANVVGADTRCAPNGTSSLFAFVKVAQPTDSFGAPSLVVSVRTSDGDGVEPLDLLQARFDDMHSCTTVGVPNDELPPDQALIVYPNPTRRVIHIEGVSAGQHRIEILDHLGQLQLRASHDLRKPLDISHLKGGIYFVRLDLGDVWLAKTFIKL